MGRRSRVVAASIVVLLAACTRGDDSGDGDAGGSSTTRSDQSGRTPSGDGDDGTSDRPKGGTARVGVWAEPDLGAPHVGGAALRALVYPQLFVAGPDGEWRASLVEPGTDMTARDAASATFRIREDAVWSDGTPVTGRDLQASADDRFVAAVEVDENDPRRVVVRFTQPYPGWRRLWSFRDTVTPPREGLWGGPFQLTSFTDGLEAVLRPNDRWWGSGPFLSELRLVLVPNSVIAQGLLERGELDVVMPPAATVRTDQLEAIEGVDVQRRVRSGWWTALHLNPARLDHAEREALAATVDRRKFVGTLLKGEASVLDGLASPEDDTWAGVESDDVSGLPPSSEEVDLVGMLEEPMRPVLQRAMQRRAHPTGARLELRNAEIERVTLWLAAGEYDAAISLEVDPPEVCWTCRFAGVDEATARDADAGNQAAVAALEGRLRDEYLLLPLWRHAVVVAWRPPLRGPAANGYALSAAWNASTWWYDEDAPA